MNIVIKNNSRIKNSAAILLVHDYYYGKVREAIERARAMKVNMKIDELPGKKTVIFTVYEQVGKEAP